METTGTEIIDTGEKRDARGRRITPAERRAELVTTYRQSGLTQAAFARREGVRYSTFASWVQEERKGSSGSAAKRPAAVRFAEVRWPGAVRMVLEVRLADGTVLRGDSASELAALARALRA